MQQVPERFRWGHSGLVAGAVLLASLAAALPAAETARAAERTEKAVPAPSRAEPRAVPIGAAVQKLVLADWIDQDRRFAAGKPGTRQQAKTSAPGVTTAQDAAGGVDGVKNGSYGFHTASAEQDPWWQVDLGNRVRLDRVVVYNRTDANTAPRTRNLRVLVAPGQGQPFREVYQHNAAPFLGATDGKPLVVDLKPKGVEARIVRLAVPGRCSFALDEVEVYAAGDPARNIALGKPADQKSVGQYSVAHPIGGSGAAAATTLAHDGDFSPAHCRDVLARGRKLLARLRPKANPQRLDPLAAELDRLDARLAGLSAGASAPLEVRRQLYLDARQALRKIAMANPLLDFDKLLFIKRHDSVGVYHMCDQYYGCNARPGGGLFVLSDPFSDNPKLVDLLENSVVRGGRLAGHKLAGGAFLSPELSFDGQTILFAHTQATAYAQSQGKETYLWGPEISHHLFRVNADGTGLVQLTDGDSDDFDPCFLPNGRVVFVSLRRGGYLRCGRHCPVYTLHSMQPYGTDLICLSFHETHEWNPSVTNDGMLVYTRWDYVDRDTNIAHHLWTCYPDGRDPRSFHGNYPEKRESRPWMEMQIRAIPGSPLFVASTGSHHGHEFGSLVLVNPRRTDDLGMSQLTRLTPDVPFPEAEGRPINLYAAYGSPWPLSEDDYLCVYDAEAKNRGIYWIDRDGNKELIYRDPEICCVSPIPLRPRPVPPVIPEATVQTASARAAAGKIPPATVAVMNVYDSDFTWPAGTRVAALRVIQVLPKTTAPPNEPRIGVAEQTNARAALGTVPVEADGSAYFEAPAGKEIYFQALDARGMAVQSMRSGTYLHPGERMTCLGCHERKHRPPAVGDCPDFRAAKMGLSPSGKAEVRENGTVPLVGQGDRHIFQAGTARKMSQSPAGVPQALRRPPSPIAPEADGSNPFNFVRLVQPVLDRQCVGCHREKKALDLSATVEGAHGWTRSYTNLAGKYGFYFHVSNGAINTGVHGGSRTIPGQFGARASKMLAYLGPEHYGVRLPDEDFRRIVLWLDCNSEFFGSYENTRAQARGEVVLPTLD